MWIAYATLALGASAWAASRVSLFGAEQLIDELAEGNRQTSRMTVFLLFAVLITAGWAIAAFAATAPGRSGRVVITAVVVVAAGVAMWVCRSAARLNELVAPARSEFPPIDFEVHRFSPTVLWAVTCVVCITALLAAAPTRALNRWPVVTGLVAVAPIIAVFVVWMVAPHTASLGAYFRQFDTPETREWLAAPASTHTLEFVTGALFALLSGALGVLALLDAVEVANAKSEIGGTPKCMRWSVSRRTFVVLAAVNLAVISSGLAGLLPGGTDKGDVWHRGSALEWVFAVALVGGGAFFVRSLNRQRVASGLVRPRTMVVVACLAIPPLLLLSAALLSLTAGWIERGSGSDDVVDWLMNRAIDAKAWAPLAAVVVAAVQLAWVLLQRPRWSDGAVLLTAFVAWATVPALLRATSNRTTDWTLSTRVLDLVVTVVLIVWAMTAKTTRVGLQSATVVVIVASLIAFGDQWLPTAVEHRFFLLLFLAPVIWRFLVDTSDLHEGSGRKLVVAAVVWGVFLAVSALAASDTSLFVEDSWDLAGRFEWRLLTVPLCFTFVWMILRVDRPRGYPDAHDDGASSAPVVELGPERRHGIAAETGSHRWIPAVTAATCALVAVGIVAGGLITVAGTDAEAVARPDVRVDVTLQDGWSPACAWVNGDGEGIALTLGEQTLVLAEHIPEGISFGNPTSCAADMFNFIVSSGACSTPLPPASTRVSIAGMAGGELVTGGMRLQCANSPGPSGQRLVMIAVPTGRNTPSALDRAQAQAAAIFFSGS